MKTKMQSLGGNQNFSLRIFTLRSRRTSKTLIEMKLMNRKVRFNPFRRRHSKHVDVAPSPPERDDTDTEKSVSIDDKEYGECKRRQLSPLSSIMAKFIVESAEKTYNSIESDLERSEFADSIEFVLNSVRNGKDVPQQRNSVVELLAKTTRATMESIDNEEEQDVFLRGISDRWNSSATR